MYLPSSAGVRAVTMKNDVVALAGSSRQVPDEGLLRLAERLLARRQVPALNHEAARHAVKRRAVVHARRGQPEKIAHVIRRAIRKEFHGDVPHGGLDHRAVVRQVGH